MRFLIAAALIATAGAAWGATAYFTGRMEFITTVTGQPAWRCEYDFAGTRFWRIFKASCPASVEVY
jgi:hypothetical protein